MTYKVKKIDYLNPFQKFKETYFQYMFVCNHSMILNKEK